jgi:hypothetical protein
VSSVCQRVFEMVAPSAGMKDCLLASMRVAYSVERTDELKVVQTGVTMVASSVGMRASVTVHYSVCITGYSSTELDTRTHLKRPTITKYYLVEGCEEG